MAQKKRWEKFPLVLHAARSSSFESTHIFLFKRWIIWTYEFFSAENRLVYSTICKMRYLEWESYEKALKRTFRFYAKRFFKGDFRKFYEQKRSLVWLLIRFSYFWVNHHKSSVKTFHKKFNIGVILIIFNKINTSIGKTIKSFSLMLSPKNRHKFLNG